MSAEQIEAVGFWSYVHQDDSDEDGRIVRLAARIQAEFGFLRNERLELFVDRGSLAWGDEWRSAIDRALSTTAFFIPVITPRYFRSEECRRELLTFAGHAKSLGVEELLLPILYAHVDGLDRTSDDEAVALVAATHYADWRGLRFEEESSAAYRKGVHELTRRLDVASDALVERATARIVRAVPAGEEGVDEAPGLVELLADGEQATRRLAATLAAFPEVFRQLSAAAVAGVAEVRASDAQGGGYAGRLAATRNLALALGEPSERVASLGADYASHMVQVDPYVLTLIRRAEAIDTEEEWESANEFFTGVRAMADGSHKIAEALRSLFATMEESGRLSRELRPPLERIRSGLRGVLDADAIMEEWERRMDQVTPPDLPGRDAA